MIVSIASGKGGTGKTTLAASLATVWQRPVAAVDLDVEEPNLHLFLNPQIDFRKQVFMEVPVADLARCTRCGVCADLCQFGAISVVGQSLLIFPEMCHGCGGCLGLCPESALSPGKRELGESAAGRAGDIHFLSGRLRVGEAMSPPLMREVLKMLFEMLADRPLDAIIDSPPGVSCPAVTAVLESDCIVLAAEPTPFGFHDFALAYEAFAPLGKPMGVVINRAGLGDETVQSFCQEKGLPVLAEIPFDRAVAEGYAKGLVASELRPDLMDLFTGLALDIDHLTQGGGRA